MQRGTEREREGETQRKRERGRDTEKERERERERERKLAGQEIRPMSTRRISQERHQTTRFISM